VRIGHAPLHLRGGAAHARGHAVDESISPLNMSTIMAFVTWFSGVGYILTGWEGVSTPIASAVATVFGFVGAGIVFLVLVRVLLPGQSAYLSPDDYELEGTIGRLITSIRPGGTGEFVFSKAGSRRVASARSTSASGIERDTEVVVVRQDKGIVYVEPFTELLAQTHRDFRGQ
jgi:membrane protein implicated in regulation of membrane protease activity